MKEIVIIVTTSNKANFIQHKKFKKIILLKC